MRGERKYVRLREFSLLLSTSFLLCRLLSLTRMVQSGRTSRRVQGILRPLWWSSPSSRIHDRSESSHRISESHRREIREEIRYREPAKKNHQSRVYTRPNRRVSHDTRYDRHVSTIWHRKSETSLPLRKSDYQ